MSNKIQFTVFGSIGNSDLGDDAYVKAAIDKIDSMLGKNEWKILSGNPAETRARCCRESYLGFMRPDPDQRNVLIAYFSAVRQMIECIAWGVLYPGTCRVPQWMSAGTRNLLEILINSDIIVNFGGGFLNEDYRKAFLSELIFLWLCERINKPVALLAQSLGPFYSSFTRILAIRALNRCDILTIREIDSFKVCQSLNLTKPKVEMTADCALLLSPPPQDEVNDYARIMGIPANDHAIGFSVRRWKYPGSKDPKKKHLHYVETIAEVADSLAHQTNAHIILVPTSTRPNDLIVCEEIKAKIYGTSNVYIAGDGTDLETVRKAITRCQLFIGTRLHPLIFATRANVPSLAISYTPKVAGYMQMIKRGDLAFPIDDISKKELFEAGMDLWRRRPEEAQYLEYAMEGIVNKAELNIEILINKFNLSEKTKA